MDVYDLAAKLILLAWYLGILTLGALLAAKVLIPGRYRYDFVMGIGPRIASFSIGTTYFELRLIPLFVSKIYYYGGHASSWRRLGVQLGGPIAMSIVGVLIVFAILVTGIWVPRRPGAEIAYVKATQMDLRENDIILEADGHTIADGADLAKELLKDQPEKIDFLVERNGSNLPIEIDRQNAAETERILVFRSVTRTESPGIWKAVAMVPQTMWDSLVFRWCIPLTLDRRLWTYLGSAHRFKIKIADDLFLLGLFFLTLYTATAILEFGFMMVAALWCQPSSQADRIQRILSWGAVICVICVILGVEWVFLIHYFPANAVSIFDTPLVESAIRRMPVNVYWQVKF